MVKLPGIHNLRIADLLLDIHNRDQHQLVHIIIVQHQAELQLILNLPERVEQLRVPQEALNHVHILHLQGPHQEVPTIVVHQVQEVAVALTDRVRQIQVAREAIRLPATPVLHEAVQVAQAILVQVVVRAVQEAQAALVQAAPARHVQLDQDGR
jgi:hypothetical protein